MARTVNKELARFIIERFNDMMKITGFDLSTFAAYSKIGPRSLRSYHSGTIPISVETLKKICDAYEIPLKDFLGEDKKLRINDSIKNQLYRFLVQHRLEQQELISEEKAIFSEKPIGSGNKWEREMIRYIVLHTDYFDTSRSIAEMTIDFAKDFELVLESGRIYELLRKYVDHEIKREKSTRINNDHSTSNRIISLYKKA